MSSHQSHTDRLIQEVIDAAKGCPSDPFENDEARQRLKRATTQLSGALDNPIDTIQRVWFEALHLPTIRIAIDAGWFQSLQAGPKTAAELAKEVDGEELLIVRLMRILTAAGVVDERGPQTYASTPITNALTIPKIYHGIQHFAYEGMPIWADFPDWVIKNGYKLPEHSSQPPFVEKFGKIQWEYFEDHPERGKSFNTFMEGQREGRNSWLDIYPAKERLIDGIKVDESEVLLVDVGGGRGHEVQDFRDRIGTKFGRLVLEDLPEVIEGVHPESIEPVPYDFYTAQPIKGARAYYFRNIFHDWSDEKCRKILKNQALAMKKGHSKLLLNDILVPETRAPAFVAGMDITMMTLHAGMERTQKQWQALLESEGFRLVDIWQVGAGPEAIIEGVLQEYLLPE